MKKGKKKRLWIILAIIGGVIIISILCLIGLYLLGTSSEEETTDNNGEFTDIIEITPTITVESSESLTVRDIEQNHNDLTDVQWEKYITEHLGEKITFRGEVVDVYDDHISITDDSEKNFFTTVHLYGIPYDTLITLTKDDNIIGEGVIRDIDDLLGLEININVTSFELEN